MFDLGKELAKELSKYNSEITKEIKKVVKNEAKKLAENIKNDSPDRTGNYKDGWTYVEESETPFGIVHVVYNSNAPQLTHLLEYGHAKRDGGRVEGTNHIEPNEKKTIESVQRSIIEVIQNGN